MRSIKIKDALASVSKKKERHEAKKTEAQLRFDKGAQSRRGPLVRDEMTRDPSLMKKADWITRALHDAGYYETVLLIPRWSIDELEAVAKLVGWLTLWDEKLEEAFEGPNGEYEYEKALMQQKKSPRPPTPTVVGHVDFKKVRVPE